MSQKKTKIIVPQYHSSICKNNCQYCSFRYSNKQICRTRLSDNEFKLEIEKFIQYGYRTIEFVFASDSYFTPERIGQRIKVAKAIGLDKGLKIKIGLNADTFSVEGYEILKKAGLDFFVVWMETYNKKIYSQVHPEGTYKADFDNRFTAYERAIKAGLSKYGLGVLWGLSNWEKDLDSLITHGQFLEQKYGHWPYIVGVPRLKNALNTDIGVFDNIIDDETYKFICKEIKKAFPHSMLFLNTRESFDLNLQLLNGGIDLFTIDCKTFPGAYLNNDILAGEQEQFKTKCYNRNQAIEAIKGKGYNPIFDW